MSRALIQKGIFFKKRYKLERIERDLFGSNGRREPERREKKR
jgi:hypothetical protein